MGCHTWFYKLSEIDSLDKVKQKALELLEEIKNDPERKSEYEIQFDKLYRYAIDENLDLVVGEFVGINMDHHSTYFDGKIWVDVDIHDIFRLGGYPDDHLFSYEKTLEYCKDKNVELDSKQLDQLKEFWQENPNGMIRFG